MGKGENIKDKKRGKGKSNEEEGGRKGEERRSQRQGV